MRRKGVIARRGSCRGLLPRKAWRTEIHIKTIRDLRVVDPRGSLYATLYARRILVDPGILFLFTHGWILVDPDVREDDPEQWITGIRGEERGGLNRVNTYLGSMEMASDVQMVRLA